MSLMGCVDMLADTCISGWAADDADQELVQVDVIVNAQRVATVACEVFREDLLRAGIGDGRKGFRFDPSAYLKPGRNELEVHYAGQDSLLPRGRGHWVRRHTGRLAEGDAAFLAALEAHFEFAPDCHICGAGNAAEHLEKALLAAAVPFRRFTRLDGPPGQAAARLTEKLDLAVYWEWGEPRPDGMQVWSTLVRDNLKDSGVLALGCAETPEAATQIRKAFEECGAVEVKLESIPAAESGRRHIIGFAGFATAGGGGAPAPEPTPMLAHIHVPKCAGTSFRVLLENYFGPRHLSLYVNDTDFVYGNETLRSYLLQNAEIRGFSSHHVRMFPQYLAGRRMLYVTFLRDPIQQFVSYMTHIQKHYAGITSESLLAAVPPDAPRLTLREFARWLLTQDRAVPFRENHNVNFFTRHSSPADSNRLKAAKAVLGDFFFVGITERMEQSMAKLRALTLAAGVDFPSGPALIENTSAEFRDDLRWIHPDDEVGSLLWRSVEEDRQLYDWAARGLLT